MPRRSVRQPTDNSRGADYIDCMEVSRARLSVTAVIPFFPFFTWIYMTKVTNKVSIYGDSMRIAPPGGQSTAERLRLNPKFSAGVNDFAVGGTSFYGTLRGTTAAGATSTGVTNLWNDWDFLEHLGLFDDGDIVVISLGGNDQPAGVNQTTGAFIENLGPGTDSQGYVGADALSIAADCLSMCQVVVTAGKRPVLVTTPYTNLTALLADPVGAYSDALLNHPVWMYTVEQRTAMASAFMDKATMIRLAIRIISGQQNYPYILPFGVPGPVPSTMPTASSVIDGVHPTVTYSNAVSDFIGTEIVRIFGL